MNPCTVPECAAAAKRRGLCNRHYQRWRTANPGVEPVRNVGAFTAGQDPVNKGKPVQTNTGRTHFLKGHVPANKGAGLDRICTWCGIEYRAHGRRPRSYCSHACRGAARSGPNHPAWDGGKTSENEKLRKSRRYAEWRRAVFARDDYTCQHCGARGVRIHADHEKPWALYPALRFDIDNGRTLCVPCHRKTPTWGRACVSA